MAKRQHSKETIISTLQNLAAALKNMHAQIIDCITIDPNQMGGTPCIRGRRIPVATVVGMLAEGMTDAEILAAYPDLELADIRAALRFATETIQERELPLLKR